MVATTPLAGKLKDLGNMFLGNFGLSVDNFKATKDESSGSYNISYDPNPSQGNGERTASGT